MNIPGLQTTVQPSQAFQAVFKAFSTQPQQHPRGPMRGLFCLLHVCLLCSWTTSLIFHLIPCSVSLNFSGSKHIAYSLVLSLPLAHTLENDTFLDVTPAGCKFCLIGGLCEALPSLISERGKAHSSLSYPVLLSRWDPPATWSGKRSTESGDRQSRLQPSSSTYRLTLDKLSCRLWISVLSSRVGRTTSTSQVGWHVKIASCQIQKKCISFPFSSVIDKHF